MNDENLQQAQEFEYKAEMKQLLNIIVNSLYKNKEIFLRELVSNSSDALNKVRFMRLTDSEIPDAEIDLRIDINIDKENKTFSIEDSGVGMRKEDLIDRIGTVASSGTLDFLTNLKNTKNEIDAQLIGQFGVGFYSVFMVTDEITIETKFASKDAEAYKWTSSGQDKYTIEPSDREKRGTKISFKFKDEYYEFSDDWRVKSILKKYSNFVDFPVYVNNEKVNTVQALWHKKKEDIKEEELNEFYKFISNDFQDPLDNLHLAIEGVVNFKALLFIPQTAPPMLFTDITEKSLQLYSKKVFIQDDCKELLPDYLKFLKGVVDTEDLPLNVSREVTQSSPVLAKIKNVITSKILTLLDEWSDKDIEKYNKFYKNFSSLFKIGINTDFSNKDKLIELLRFESSVKPAGEWTSFNGYVSRMKPNQKEIYYVLGEHREMLERNPNLEYFKKKDIEVLFLTDPVDVFTIPYIMTYDNKPLKSIDKAEINIEEIAENKIEKLDNDLTSSLIKVFKDTLGDVVENVTESKRLVDSLATLVSGKEGLDPQMERMMKAMDVNYTGSKKILEINTSHPLIKNLSRIYIADEHSQLLRDSIFQIYEGAVLIAGPLKDPGAFVKRMTDLMVEATK